MSASVSGEIISYAKIDLFYLIIFTPFSGSLMHNLELEFGPLNPGGLDAVVKR